MDALTLFAIIFFALLLEDLVFWFLVATKESTEEKDA